MSVILTLITPRWFWQWDYETLLNEINSGTFITKSLLLFPILISILIIFYRVVTAGFVFSVSGLRLWQGAMIFSLCPLFSAWFGINPGLDNISGFIGTIIIFTAAYMLPGVPIEWFTQQLKKVILFYAYGSLLAAVVAWELVVESPYTGSIIPLLDFRLHGIARHANHLGILMVFYMVLSWLPGTRLRGEYLHYPVVLAVLFLSQSKTSWASLAVAYGALWVYTIFTGGKKELKKWFYLFVSAILLASGVLHIISSPLSHEAGSNLITLTGRTEVWEIVIDLWRENPWFGYGPNLFSPDMQLQFARVLGWLPTHAHSQYYQTLGESGIIGMVGLVVFCLILIWYSFRLAPNTRGVSLAIVLLLLVRNITEPTFLNIIGSTDSMTYYFMFWFLMVSAKSA